MDRVLCTSVLQYLDDAQLRAAFREFARILKKDGTLVLHVKNLASLYLSLCGWRALLRSSQDTKLEYFVHSVATSENSERPVFAF